MFIVTSYLPLPQAGYFSLTGYRGLTGYRELALIGYRVLPHYRNYRGLPPYRELTLTGYRELAPHWLAGYRALPVTVRLTGRCYAYRLPQGAQEVTINMPVRG